MIWLARIAGFLIGATGAHYAFAGDWWAVAVVAATFLVGIIAGLAVDEARKPKPGTGRVNVEIHGDASPLLAQLDQIKRNMGKLK